MSAMQIAGRSLETNRKGFLAHFDDWDPELAQSLAEQEGLILTECHWKVLKFLRNYYAIHEIPPSPRVIVKHMGHEISVHVPCTRRHFDALFPDGGCHQACRLAGLPDYYCHGC
jgi:dissimilatory sulfite reductase related protein